MAQLALAEGRTDESLAKARRTLALDPDYLPQVMDESVRAHKKVADAIARRDSAAARAAMERLVKQSTEHIQRVLHPARE